MTIFKSTPVLSPHSFAWAILPSDEFRAVTQVFVNTTVNDFLDDLSKMRIRISR